METAAVTPGQRLGYAEDYIAGPGTYERDGLLYASVVGLRRIEPGSDGKVSLDLESITPTSFIEPRCLSAAHHVCYARKGTVCCP